MFAGHPPHPWTSSASISLEIDYVWEREREREWARKKNTFFLLKHQCRPLPILHQLTPRATLRIPTGVWTSGSKREVDLQSSRLRRYFIWQKKSASCVLSAQQRQLNPHESTGQTFFKKMSSTDHRFLPEIPGPPCQLPSFSAWDSRTAPPTQPGNRSSDVLFNPLVRQGPWYWKLNGSRALLLDSC